MMDKNSTIELYASTLGKAWYCAASIAGFRYCAKGSQILADLIIQKQEVV